MLAVLALFSCGDPAEEGPVENPGPVLVSTDPADGTGGLVGAYQTVVFTFDQNIACTPEGLEGISVDGEAFIEKVTPSGVTLTVVVAGLSRGKS